MHDTVVDPESFKPTAKKKTKKSRRIRKPRTVSDFWYGEVVLWRRMGCFFWFFVLFCGCLVLSNFPILPSFPPWGATLLYCLSLCFMIFSQMILMTVQRGNRQLNSIPTIGGCALMGCTTFLALLSYLSNENFFTISLLSECVEQFEGSHSTRLAYCLHEPMLCTIFCCFSLSGYIAFHFIWKEEYLLAYPSLQQGRWFRVKSRIPLICSDALEMTLIGLGVIYGIYFIWNSLIVSIAAWMLSSFVSLPIYVYPALWQSRFTFSLPLLVPLSIASLLTIGFVKLGKHLLDVFLTQEKSLEAEKNDKNRWLIEGLTSDDYGLLYPSLLDLTIVTKYNAIRRRALFTNSQDCSIVMQQCCSIIDHLTNQLAEAAQDTDSADGFTRLYWLKSFFSNLDDWQTFPPGYKRTQVLFKDAQLVMWSAEAISTLIAVAHREDSQGTLQNVSSIRTVLNSLLSCLVAIDRFIESYDRDPPPGFEGNTILAPYTYPMVTTLKTAVYRITVEYFTNLEEIKLNSTVIEKLQSFVKFEF